MSAVLRLVVMMMAKVVSTVTYATWNPADKNANITLSNGNLTATNSVANCAVRATIGKTTGKWYWEITNGSVNEQDIGVGNASMTLNGYVGKDANGVGYDSSDGKLYKGDVAVATGGATYTAADIIGFALDVDAGTLKVYKNNTLQYTYTYGFTGTIYPALGAFAAASGTANFGATALTYSPPAGYNAGVYV